MGTTENSFETVGSIGIIFNGLFMLMAGWRSYVAYDHIQNLRDNKVLIHLALLTFSMLEFLYSVSLLVYEK